MRLSWRDPETGIRALVVLGPGPAPALAAADLSPVTDEREVNRALTVLVREHALRAGALGMDVGVAGVRLFPVADADRAIGLAALGRFLTWLGGRVRVYPGPGLSPDELAGLYEEGHDVAGLPREAGGSGDPSPWTALGAFAAIRGCVEDVRGRRVGVLGAGRVGRALVRLLSEAGAEVMVADLVAARAARAAEVGRVEVVSPQALLACACDVLSPNARGPVVTPETLPKLRCAFIAGAANGQLAEPGLAEALRKRGIGHVPELLAGAGWFLNLLTELVPGGYEENFARVRVLRIEDAAAEALRVAKEEGLTGYAAIERVADRWRASG